MVIPPTTTRTVSMPIQGNLPATRSASFPVSLLRPRPVEQPRLVIKQPDPLAQQVAAIVGDREVGDDLMADTDHAWLVVLGHFAQSLDLIDRLNEVPLAQRQGRDGAPPQHKLIEFLVGILGGIEQLQELNLAPQPIATDQTVAQAWEQTDFRHYSQVSRTLAAADEETLAGVIEALRQVSAPFIQASVAESLKQQGHLTLDIDLTGRPVSPTSENYPDASFGWMDDGVSKGYQAAITSLVSERWQRLLLTLQRYPGRTLSADCLQAAVLEAETTLQLRPRRRVELVQQRRQAQADDLARWQAKLDTNQARQQQLWTKLRAINQEIEQLTSEVEQTAALYQQQGRSERPHSKLAKLRQRLAAAQKRRARTWRQLTHLQQQAQAWQPRLDQAQHHLLALDEWLAQLEADNWANPNPITLRLRIDAGFSTGANLTWLIEMGYTVITKAHHSGSADRLRRQLAPTAAWTTIGKNAEAVAMGAVTQNNCPYPLQAMLVRYHLPDRLRHTSLLYYGDTPPPDLPGWFKLYNARQTIEAGIKEEKDVFTLKRHLVQSPVGMQLQEQFALFAANLTRWTAAWVNDLLAQANQSFITALGQVKTLVNVVTRCRARWLRQPHGHTLIFDDAGPFAGTVLRLAGQVAVQLPLPLFNFAPL